MDRKQEKSERNTYAWVVFGACFFMIFVALGFGSSTKGTYLTAITGQLGLSRGLFTLNDSMRYIATTILNFLFGVIVIRLGARRMVAFGFVFLTASFVVCGYAQQYWQFYIGGFLLGAGLAWTTTTVVGHIVENWFTSNKGTIMGIILAANGLGGVASEQIITRVIYGAHGTLSVQDSHWRKAYFITAALFAITGVIVVILIRNKPSDKGLKPLGSEKKNRKRGNSWDGLSMKEIRRKPYFYISGACVFFIGMIVQTLSNVAKPHMYDMGQSKEFVLYAFSFYSLILVFAKIGTGIFFDRHGIRPTIVICCIASIIGSLLLSFITGQSKALVWIYCLISPFCFPLETVVIPLMVSEMFGQKEFSRITGYYVALNTLGYTAGVPLANAVFDMAGTYKPYLFLSSVAMAVITVVSLISITWADRERNRVVLLQDSK